MPNITSSASDDWIILINTTHRSYELKYLMMSRYKFETLSPYNVTTFINFSSWNVNTSCNINTLIYRCSRYPNIFTFGIVPTAKMNIPDVLPMCLEQIWSRGLESFKLTQYKLYQWSTRWCFNGVWNKVNRNLFFSKIRDPLKIWALPSKKIWCLIYSK